MILNVANSCFSEDFLNEVSRFNTVKILFGKLPNDIIGGGCEAILLPDVNKDILVNYIQQAYSKGILFNYVINSPFLNNLETSENGRKKINELLDFLNTLPLESVTVANPFLLMYIKKNYKNLRVKASATFMIDSVDKALKIKQMGADIIVLDPLLVNRNFETLRKIRSIIGEEIELIVNNNCLLNCPMLTYHQTYLGLSSKKDCCNSSSDLCYSICSQLRLSDSCYYIKGDWIRPEDLHYYEEIGYDRFKIIDRCAPSDIMVKRIKAYTERKYSGNLLDLIQHYCYQDEIDRTEYLKNIYIDNSKLDGFLEHFVSGKCNGRDCSPSCNYCRKFADSAIEINKSFKNFWSARKNNLTDSLLS